MTAKPLPEYIVFLLDSLNVLGAVSARRMFGGYGIYKNGLMFAIVVDDVLYFKTSPASVSAYQSRGLPPFTYQKQGKTCQIAYYQCPDEALEEPEAMLHWAGQAFEVARNNKK